MAGTGSGWGIVVPVKRLDAAKSRLSARAARQRRRLALAFALDVVEACATVSDEVVVVASDEEVRAGAAQLGATAVRERADEGLAAAVREGAELLQQRVPGKGVAILVADLPALRADDLLTALAAAATHDRAFVADLAGTGTTMLTARSGIAPAARFGPRSRAAHAASGAVELRDPGLVRLRCDVDTEVDLWYASVLGLGPRSAVAAAAAGRSDG